MVSMDWLVRHRQTKEAETDRPVPNAAGACPLLYPFFSHSPFSAHVAARATLKLGFEARGRHLGVPRTLRASEIQKDIFNRPCNHFETNGLV